MTEEPNFLALILAELRAMRADIQDNNALMRSIVLNTKPIRRAIRRNDNKES